MTFNTILVHLMTINSNPQFRIKKIFILTIGFNLNFYQPIKTWCKIILPKYFK